METKTEIKKRDYNFKITEELKTANAKIEELTRKNEELTKLCKSFAEKTTVAEKTLANATLEYNARVQYMLDAIQHCMLSIRFASAAQTQINKENNNANKF